MDYTQLMQCSDDRKSRVGIVGATKGYGYTLLAQIPTVSHMELRAICSRHTDECEAVLRDIGYDMKRVVFCENTSDIEAAPEDAIIIVSDYKLVIACGITALVEATGNTAVSADAARLAIEAGINVYMVSKETDSICGPYLNDLAARHNVVYTLVNGDQPRNLLDLYSWARLLGLDIVAAGKSSEYDFVWNRDTGDFTLLDGAHESEPLPGLADYWHYSGPETLKGRDSLLKHYREVISADLCEMNLVSNVTGFTPAAPTLNYPILRPSELADVFIPVEDGGILEKTGVVDVFYNLRDIDEASFCGGEFIIIRCENEAMWEILIGKGHVVSRSRKYCCIYYPYHFMGLETPVSILLGDLCGIGCHPECRQVSVLTGIATEKLAKGTKLVVHGHHHEIDGVTPNLLERGAVGNAAPYYLLNGAELFNDIEPGRPITLDDVDLSGLETYRLYLEGLKLS